MMGLCTMFARVKRWSWGAPVKFSLAASQCRISWRETIAIRHEDLSDPSHRWIPQHLFTIATGGHYITMLLAG